MDKIRGGKKHEIKTEHMKKCILMYIFAARQYP